MNYEFFCLYLIKEFDVYLISGYYFYYFLVNFFVILMFEEKR